MSPGIFSPKLSSFKSTGESFDVGSLISFLEEGGVVEDGGRNPTRRGGDIFRAEALEHQARSRGPGDVVRVAPRWTTAAFYGLLGLFVAALIAGLVVEIDRYVAGTTAADDEGRLVVLLPAALAAEVASGRPVQVGDATAEVVSTTGGVLYPPQVKSRYGVDVVAPSVAVVTSARAEGSGERARVLVEREPALVALVPGFKALFGDDDA